MDQNSTPPVSNTHKVRLSIDLRLICVVLLLVIMAMLIVWKPWSRPAKATDRTISVSGEATITAAPDQYIFNPSYEFKDANKATALQALTTKSDDLVTKLKALGVANDKIKTNASGNNYQYYYDSTSNQNTYTLQLTITLTDQKLSQKVQDYLVTTSPLGELTPSTSFSTTTQKKLESQARDAATKDARSKADQSAKNLGFKISNVKSVDDGTGFGGGGCGGNLCAGSITALDSAKASGAAPQLTVQPGQNDLTYSVTVVYFIK
jgi:uncharacterized protein YggE